MTHAMILESKDLMYIWSQVYIGTKMSATQGLLISKWYKMMLAHQSIHSKNKIRREEANYSLLPHP